MTDVYITNNLWCTLGDHFVFLLIANLSLIYPASYMVTWIHMGLDPWSLQAFYHHAPTIDGLSGAISREQTARVFLQGYPQFPLDKGELPRDLDT